MRTLILIGRDKFVRRTVVSGHHYKEFGANE